MLLKPNQGKGAMSAIRNYVCQPVSPQKRECVTNVKSTLLDASCSMNDNSKVAFRNVLQDS